MTTGTLRPLPSEIRVTSCDAICPFDDLWLPGGPLTIFQKCHLCFVSWKWNLKEEGEMQRNPSHQQTFLKRKVGPLLAMLQWSSPGAAFCLDVIKRHFQSSTGFRELILYTYYTLIVVKKSCKNLEFK